MENQIIMERLAGHVWTKWGALGEHIGLVLGLMIYKDIL